jgi:anti-sigma B factor antagonist
VINTETYIETANSEIRISYSLTMEDPRVFSVSIVGVVDTNTSDLFIRCMDTVYRQNPQHIIFNCFGLNYMSSTGIGAISSVWKSMRARSGKIAIYGLRPQIYNVFSLLGFSTIIPCVDTLDRALSAICKCDEDEPNHFPRKERCPICKKTLNFPRVGKFKCKSCTGIIGIDMTGCTYIA